jgi:hypothetical protein
MQGWEWLMLLQVFIKEALTFIFPFSQMVHLVVLMKISTSFCEILVAGHFAMNTWKQT